MIIITDPSELKNKIRELKCVGANIAFVPTMGALHEGHLSLVNQAKKNNAFVVVSIFVNPLQFNQTEDFDKYPNQQEQDITLLKNNRCDLLFLPSVATIYPHKTVLGFELGKINQSFEGLFRPGHFNGVAVVVSKLFNMVQPDVAYFGKKDLQQLSVIQQLVADLSFPITIVGCETLRAANGLALSSRNQRLSEASQSKAGIIFQSLSDIKQYILENKQAPEFTPYKNAIEQCGFNIEYLSLIQVDDFSEVTDIKPNVSYAIIFAGVIDNVRLIDNVLFIL
jgi:pantoate--beta-alanine ligase